MANNISELEIIYHGSKLKKLINAPFKMLWTEVLKKASYIHPLAIPVRTKTFWSGAINVMLPEDVSLQIYRYGILSQSPAPLYLPS